MKTLLFLLFFASANFWVLSQNVSHTILSPTSNGKIVESYNTVYCSSFDNMWLKMRNEFNYLNISDSVLIEIDNEIIKSKTIEDSFITSNINTSSNSIEVSSFLFKKVEFSTSFNKEFNLQTFDNKAKVDCFGFINNDPNFKRNFELIDYQNKNDFILKVKCIDSLDEIYLAKIQNNSTLQETYNSVIERIDSGIHQNVCGNDIVKIPFLKIDSVFNINELISKEFVANWYIKDAYQKTKFELDKTGISVESKSSSVIQFSDFEDQGYYTLIFNQPFLVVMKRKNFNNPYFLMWVGNDELMKSHSIEARNIKESERKFIGLWQSSKVTEGKSIYDIQNIENYRNLKSDGTYIETIKNRVKNEGSWSYNESTNKITFKPFPKTENSAEKIEKCIQISDNELIFKSEEYETVWIKR